MLETAFNIFYLILHVVNQGSFPKPLSAEEERQCLQRMQAGDKEARNLLIERNLRLVAHIVKKYYTSCDEQDDLISIGTVGLIKAIDSFKGDKKVRIATYAAKCVENEILMYFRSKKKTANDVSINEHIDEDKDGNALLLSDIIADDENILDTIYRKIRVETLMAAINENLDERERTIINLRYGLTEPALTQKETATRLGISRSYVSRLEKKALTVLKEKISQ